MKIETSKLILIMDFTVAVLLTAVVVIGVWLERDAYQVTVIAACWDAQLTAAVGFYYWKAKNENRSKYAMGLVKDLAEKYGMDAVIGLANTILKD